MSFFKKEKKIIYKVIYDNPNTGPSHEYIDNWGPVIEEVMLRENPYIVKIEKLKMVVCSTEVVVDYEAPIKNKE